MKIYKDSVKILNLKANMLVNEYEVTNNRKKYNLDGAMPYSKVMVQIQTIGEKVNYEKISNSVNYYGIVNVDFDCCYKVLEDDNTTHYFTDGKKVIERKGTFKKEMSSLELRQYIMKNGFKLIVDGVEVEYVPFCRSSSKVKNACFLFIKKELLVLILHNYMRLGITFKDDELLDVPSWLTYESLVCSSIIDTIKIDTKKIVCIQDLECEYKDIVSLTKFENGELKQEDTLYTVKNTIWDGQVLINSKIAPHCFQLLRTQFFKGAALSTDFEGFAKKYNIEYFTDMWGNKFKVEDVDLIITPSALKLFKFAYKFENDEAMFNYWRDNCDNEFGIVKYNKHSGNYEGKYGQLSYQVLNSIYNLSYNDVLSLMGDELQYIKLLKSDDEEYFKLHINNNSSIYNDNFINTMASLNTDFYKTDIYRTNKKKTIYQYLVNLKCSKVKIKDLDYYTIFGLPHLMLHYAAQLPINYDIEGNIIWCPHFKDGQEVFTWRNPHVSPGNLNVCKNIYFTDDIRFFDKLDEGNVCIINSGKSLMMDIYSGCDFDSDVLAITSNELLVSKVKQIKEEGFFRPPVNSIPSKKLMRTLNANDIANVDFDISSNHIGEICNLASLVLSYFCEIYNKDKTDKRLKRLADLVNMISCASGIEIDKAKKASDVDSVKIINFVRKELKGILEKDIITISKNRLTDKEREYFEKTGDKSILVKEKETYVKPLFFKYSQSDYASQYAFRLFDCPSDYVCDILDNFNTRMRRTKRVELEDLFIKNKSYEHSNRHQVQTIVDKLKAYNIEYNSIRFNNQFDELEKMISIEKTHDKLLEEFEKMRITDETIYCLLVRMFNKDEGKKIINSSKNKTKTEENIKFLRNNRLLILNTLCTTHKDEFIKCFNNFKQDVAILTEDEVGDISIWGKTYRKEII